MRCFRPRSAAGVSAAGGEALLGGVLPTPAAPLLIARYGFDLAIVLSASHNPYQDNGIKFFAGDGYKLSDRPSSRSSAELEQGSPAGPQESRDTPPEIGRVRELRGAGEDYLRELQTRFAELDLNGSRRAARLRQRGHLRRSPRRYSGGWAQRSRWWRTHPDGRNINAGCGSTHIDALAERVRRWRSRSWVRLRRRRRSRAGGGRRGEVVDGDELMALAALHLRDRGRLSGDGVVVTVMTNYGFHTAMGSAGIEVAEHEGR